MTPKSPGVQISAPEYQLVKQKAETLFGNRGLPSEAAVRRGDIVALQAQADSASRILQLGMNMAESINIAAQTSLVVTAAPTAADFNLVVADIAAIIAEIAALKTILLRP